MRAFVVGGLALLLLAGSAAAQSVSTDPKEAPTGRYAIDTRHTQVLFAIPHMGLDDYYGRFNKTSGTLDFDAAEPQKSALTVTVDMTSLDMPSPQLVDELTNWSVFDTKKYPIATFKATGIVRTGPNTGKVTGDLTIKSVTKPVTLDVTFNGGLMNPMSDAYAIGFHATATIKRTDFGITGMPWEPLVGNNVKIIIEAMLEHQKE